MVEVKKEEKKNNNILIVLLAILLTTLLVGGTTWYFMDQNAKNEKITTDAAISKLNKKITTSEKNNKNTVTPTPTVSAALTPTPTTAKDTVEALRTFCQANGAQNAVTGGISYMESANGIYGNCSLENAMLISTNVNGTWTKIYTGNGVIETALCDQYKIPNKMSGGTCNY
ncbi:MAG: hypothetical protein WCP14_01745 [bacterium]